MEKLTGMFAFGHCSAEVIWMTKRVLKTDKSPVQTSFWERLTVIASSALTTFADDLEARKGSWGKSLKEMSRSRLCVHFPATCCMTIQGLHTYTMSWNVVSKETARPGIKVVRCLYMQELRHESIHPELHNCNMPVLWELDNECGKWVPSCAHWKMSYFAVCTFQV